MLAACCVCGGPHHAMQCARAQRFVRQCIENRISPPPPPPDRDPKLVTEAIQVFQALLTELSDADATAAREAMGGWHAGNRAWHVRQGHRQHS